MTDMWANVLFGFSISLQPSHLFAVFVGTFLGTFIGVIPGLGPVATISVLLPFTFGMDPTASIILLAGIYYGAAYGGSVTSILVNLPGEASSVITGLDGYQMARQGRAGPALGIAAFGSFFAGTLGVLGLMLVGPPLAKAALQFGPPELFAVLVLGLVMVTYVAQGSRLKALMMASVGLLLAMVGPDPVALEPRFTFGSLTLIDGIPLVPMVMGLFGIAEVFSNLGSLETLDQRTRFRARVRDLLPTRKDWRESGGPIVRGGVLGFFLGILPGFGAIIPPLISYALEKRLARRPELFGKGAIAGVAGPESANNAATAGSMIPLLTLGVPPNAVMAILLGAFLLHGVPPGPLLVRDNPEIFWGVVTSMYTGNVMLLLLNIPLIGLWVKLLEVPYRVLFPLILLFCMIGVYSLDHSYVDMLVMVAFGVIGYLMRKLDYEPAPLVLAFVLGDLAEESLRQSLVISRGSFSIFLESRIALAALALAALATASALASGLSRRKRAEAA